MWYLVEGGGIMGSLFDFLRKNIEEGTPEEQEDTNLSVLENLIDELQDALQKDQKRAFDVYNHTRVRTDSLPKKAQLFSTVSAKRAELESIEAELEKKRSEMCSVEKECIDKIKSIAEKKKAEISKQLRALQEKQMQVDQAIKDFQHALVETECRSIDWLKRVDKKEIQAFEEIRSNVSTFNESNSTPIQEGFNFEETFAKALEKDGFHEIQVTEKSGDFGADILAEKDGVKYVIQCKHYSSAVGIEAIQQIYAAKIYYSAHVAVVATNSVFTKAAKILADETGVLLWAGDKVKKIMETTENS